MVQPRNWLITGCSRGFGLALAKTALGHGDRVAATARSSADVARALGNHSSLIALELDVTNDRQIELAVGSALHGLGHIDVLVNNAGYGMIGAIEETSREETQRILDVNVVGLVAVTRALLPSMRARGAGHIVNISSAGGYGGSPGWGVYGATKWAVEGLTETMAMELAEFGIKATAVALDTYDTGFMASSHRTNERIEAYASSSGVSRDLAAKPGGYGQKDVEPAAEAVYRVTQEQEPPVHLAVGVLAMHVARTGMARRQRDLDIWSRLSAAGG